MNNTVPFRVDLISPLSTFVLSGPTVNYNGSYQLTYIGVLNRTVTKNLTVTFNASDSKGRSAVTSIPIIVGDVLTPTPITDGYKIIKALYVNGYTNSLSNVPLGSVYVNDMDDWFRADRTYSVRSVGTGQFITRNGFLIANSSLYAGSYTIAVDVAKPVAGSTATGTVELQVTNIDSEYVRQAATIRIQGKSSKNHLTKKE